MTSEEILFILSEVRVLVLIPEQSLLKMERNKYLSKSAIRLAINNYRKAADILENVLKKKGIEL